VGVYVDYLIMIEGCIKVISSFKRQMQAELKMSDLGPLSFYLGIEVHQDEWKITLSQGAYATRIVEKAGLAGCNPCDEDSRRDQEPHEVRQARSFAPGDGKVGMKLGGMGARKISLFLSKTGLLEKVFF
jgi:hypothetical protein